MILSTPDGRPDVADGRPMSRTGGPVAPDGRPRETGGHDVATGGPMSRTGAVRPQAVRVPSVADGRPVGPMARGMGVPARRASDFY